MIFVSIRAFSQCFYNLSVNCDVNPLPPWTSAHVQTVSFSKLHKIASCCGRNVDWVKPLKSG